MLRAISNAAHEMHITFGLNYFELLQERSKKHFYLICLLKKNADLAAD